MNLVFKRYFFSSQFLRAHPEMANEGTPPALPQVIESLPKKNITKEQVGKCHHKEALQAHFLPWIYPLHKGSYQVLSSRLGQVDVLAG